MDIVLTDDHRKAAEDFLHKISMNEVQEMYFVLPYEMSAKFRTLMLIENDLKFIRDASVKLLSCANDASVDKTLVACIWPAVAATYGKICLKSTSGYTNIEENWFKGDAANLQTHRELMGWRNKFIAHREHSEHELSMAFIKVTKHRNLPETKTYEIRTMAKVMPTVSEIKLFIALFEYLINEVAEKIDKAATKVMGHFYKRGRDFALYHLVDHNLESFRPVKINPEDSAQALKIL
jgi:hypothetical protein